jgi:hypothetical protein
VLRKTLSPAVTSCDTRLFVSPIVPNVVPVSRISVLSAWRCCSSTPRRLLPESSTPVKCEKSSEISGARPLTPTAQPASHVRRSCRVLGSNVFRIWSSGTSCCAWFTGSVAPSLSGGARLDPGVSSM